MSGADKRRGLVLKGVIVILTVLLAGALGFFLWQESRKDRAQEGRNIQMEQKLYPFNQRRSQLRRELDSLKRTYKNEGKGMGSLVFLFTDLNENIYRELYPKLEACGFTGVLALSPGELPGQEGMLSRQEFQELVRKGWKCCFRWKDTSDPKEWIRSCREMAEELRIPQPETMYFPLDSYRSELDELLEEQGFSAAVHHGEEKQPVILTESEEGIWHPGAMAWNHTATQARLSDAISEGGNLVFTFGDDSQSERYDKDSYGYMMDYVNKCCEAGDLFVTDFSGAREYRKEQEERRLIMEREYEEHKKELEAELEEINRQIQQITEQYR